MLLVGKLRRGQTLTVFGPDIDIDDVIVAGDVQYSNSDTFIINWQLGVFCNYNCSYCWPGAHSNKYDYKNDIIYYNKIMNNNNQIKTTEETKEIKETKETKTGQTIKTEPTFYTNEIIENIISTIST